VTAEAGSPEEGLRPVAELWATVDLERALRERGRSPDDATAALVDPLLGARVVVIEGDDHSRGDAAGDEPGGDDPDGAAIALAEPTSEGRLAASLARNGEGPAGRYLALAAGDTIEAYRQRAHAAGVAISRVEPGPFGRSVLLLGRHVAGPHVIVVDRRSLPSPP
jgi:hypothetical protein